jgi:pimeloyl-ACP methyl ester carboxylesterase
MADAASMSLRSATLRVDAGVTLPDEDPLEVAVEVFVPQEPLPVALVCLPGGAMTRRYFDLRAPGDISFSFARQMAAHGFISVLIDHLGVGESSRPADGFALTVDVVNRANAHATAEIVRRLHDGTAVPMVPPLPALPTIGIGHSMGAMFTVLQQAEFRQHRAIGVLGFSTRGLPEYVTSEARQMTHAGARREVVRLAREMFREGYPMIGRSAEATTFYAGDKAEAGGVEAIKAARDRLLAVPAYLSMLPGNVAPEAAKVDVPVFVGLGELDMAGPPLEAPKAFAASPQVTFYLAPGAGHSHFLFASRAELFARLARWAESIVINGAGDH